MSFIKSMQEAERASRPSPLGRNLQIYRLANAPWWLLAILAVVALIFLRLVSESVLYREAWLAIRSGMWVSVRVTLIAYTLAIVLGLFVGIFRKPSKSLLYSFLVYQPLTIYVEVIRGIPGLVLLFYIAFALVPEAVKNLNQLGTEWLSAGVNPLGLADFLNDLTVRDVRMEHRAILALALAYSAFISEIFRAGIESVPIGQREAARSLGMSGWQVNLLIVLPQAIRNVLPPLGNDLIAMFKDSSLVSVLGVSDMTREGRDVAAATFTVFPVYNMLAITYLVMTLGLSVLVKGLETLLKRGRRD